jgi:glycosyltransferase involved in cell wall biosynthesis
VRVLMAHNFYQQAGGEDQCVFAEVAMLRWHGHDVIEYSLHNDLIDGMGRAEVAARTIWNPSSYRELRELLRQSRPEIVHFHNIFPLISPAAYYAARSEGARVVQTLHNYRLACANALLLRDGAVCEACVGAFAPWKSIPRKCYRGSRAASAVVTAMLASHRALGTWRRAVDVYIALTEFGREKFIAAGLPAGRIVVKPNFVHPDPGAGSGAAGYGIFVGRLSTEKGVETLLEAWRELGGRVPLKIIGDGPMAPLVQEAVSKDPAITWLGKLPVNTVYQCIGDAAFAVLPSVCFEAFSRVIAEAFAKGTPVVASRLGAMAELVDEGRTGLLFTPGDPQDLARTVRQLLADRSALERMRHSARAEFIRRFTAELNHEFLIAIYARALATPAGPRPAGGDADRDDSAERRNHEVANAWNRI